jgi:energy-coupling factor transport system permease protein
LCSGRIPYEIAFMVSVAIRFLPLLTDEIKNVVTAVQLRGIELDKIPAETA